MARQQIKRLAAPKSWPIPRKGSKWVTRPLPGPHKLARSLPLSIVLRDILKLASSIKEVKQILNTNEVLVNGKRMRKFKSQIGLYDTISIPKIKKHWRVLLTNKGKLNLQEIDAKESNLVPLRVVKITTVNKGKQQINFGNGWTLLTKQKYSPGDTIILNTATKEPIKHIQLKPGCIVSAIGGKHVGELAKLKDFKLEGQLKKRKIAVLEPLKDKKILETRAENIFAVGEKAPGFTVVVGGKK